MKKHFLILFILISFISFSQTFNNEKDLLLANFDLKPDEDDIMAAAALGSMLKHPDLEEVDYYAVAGAYGIQDKFTYITTATPDFFNILFGKENKKWTDAHVNWEASIKRVKKKVEKVLNSGGKIFVQEAGQSDFLYDVLQILLKEGMASTTIKENVIVVQHSKWNENQTAPLKLKWVKENTTYKKINDGNTGGNGTPGYRTFEKEWLELAKSETNLNLETRKIWQMADDVCKSWESSWTNKWIARGGLDFSDCVENWQIFNIGDQANSLPKFWTRYVVKREEGFDIDSENSKLPDTKAFYINSDGSNFLAKDFYPKFSWKTTPLYFMFGDKERVLKPEELAFISDRTDFVCIEKSHGMKQLGYAELGAKHDVVAFKKKKRGTKVLFYFNAAIAWPYTSYNKDFTKERIDEFPELKEYLLVHPKTGKLAEKFGGLLFDVLNPEFREWWAETVAKGVRETRSDGAFIDQMHGNANLRPKKKKEVEIAMGEMMALLKEKLGEEKILLANNAYSKGARHVYPVSDAIMFENYSTSRFTKESLLAEWGHMLKNAKNGKISVFRLGVDGYGRGFLKNIDKEEKYKIMPKHSQEKVEFALACYLIGAQPYSYFMYTWGWNLADGSLVDYPELQKPLGAPKGAYQRTTPNGWEFTREFERASVWVNTETREAKITWK